MFAPHNLLYTGAYVTVYSVFYSVLTVFSSVINYAKLYVFFLLRDFYFSLTQKDTIDTTMDTILLHIQLFKYTQRSSDWHQQKFIIKCQEIK